MTQANDNISQVYRALLNKDDHSLKANVEIFVEAKNIKEALDEVIKQLKNPQSYLLAMFTGDHDSLIESIYPYIKEISLLSEKEAE